MSNISKIIFFFAAFSASAVFAQTSVKQGGAINTSSVNPWVTAQKQGTPNQMHLSVKVKKDEEVLHNKWGSAVKMNGQSALGLKPTPLVVANPTINPWMKPSELKTTDFPENKN